MRPERIAGASALIVCAAPAIVHWRDRRGVVAVLAAIVPLAVFLAVDPGGGWRRGYFDGQLLASASGARGGGVGAWWFPLAVVVRRFWPGFPFLIVALVAGAPEPAHPAPALHLRAGPRRALPAGAEMGKP